MTSNQQSSFQVLCLSFRTTWCLRLYIQLSHSLGNAGLVTFGYQPFDSFM